MKIVTYNINGLRPRVSQFGSLQKLLQSLDADIICFQETKLAKQDLREELVRAEGYESFFSCTRTYDKGRSRGYSDGLGHIILMLNQMISTGVATFCRVKSAYESNEVALPVHAEEGFTGQLCNFTQNESKTNASLSTEEDFEGFSRDELLKVDSEGRCMITDHEHFVLFNVYGPRADCDDAERVQFKRTFYNIMQRRWESLLRQRRRILVVGDLNIAPAAIDRCDAGSDFENNEFRKWFRSLLRENGGIFLDVFRRKHPERKYAYTCWSTSSGAEVFNFGSRIDHILSSDSCLHEEKGHACHNFLTCHVEDCDILVQFKRSKSENGTSRWKEGRSIKMEGSDHAPVFVDLVNMPSVSKHNTPSLSSRFYPHIYGNQQTLVSMLMRRKSTAPVKQGSDSINDGNFSTRIGGQPGERPSCSLSSPNRKSDDSVSVVDEFPQGLNNVAPDNVICSSESNRSEAASTVHTRKKAKHIQGSQLSLKLFFQSNFRSASTGFSTSLGINHMSDECTSCSESVGTSQDESFNVEDLVEKCSSSQKDDHDSQKSSLINDKANFAVTEWRRIQQVMQSSIPLCKGHNEPCIVRVVKKAGPSFGQRFYVCNRAEGPASNLEANCGYFKWASSSKSKKKG